MICAPRRAIARSGKQPDRRSDNLSQTLSGLQTGQFSRIEPVRVVELFVEDRFAGSPVRGKTQYDEMAFDPVLRVACDYFAVARERNRLDIECGFLAHFTRHRLHEGFAGFDGAAGEG